MTTTTLYSFMARSLLRVTASAPVDTATGTRALLPSAAVWRKEGGGNGSEAMMRSGEGCKHWSVGNALQSGLACLQEIVVSHRCTAGIPW